MNRLRMQQQCVKDFLFKKIMIHAYIQIGILILTVFIVVGWQIRANLDSSCELILEKTKAFSGPLAREMALGNDAFANDIFQNYKTTLKQIFQDSTVSFNFHKRAGVSTQGGSEICQIGILSARYEIPLSFAGESVGMINGQLNRISWQKLILILSSIIAVIALLTLWFLQEVRNQILIHLISPLKQLSKSGAISSEHPLLKEVSEIEAGLTDLKKKIYVSERDRHQLERSKELATMASQVAHDIRSPLTAILYIEKELTTLPEETRLLLKNAIRRIQDIASNLLIKKRELSDRLEATHDFMQTNDSLQVCLLSSLVYLIIREKRPLADKFNIKINFDFQNNYGHFAKVNETEFKIVISNILNNSIEATKHGDEIGISISSHENEFVDIQIVDKGVGMPPSLIDKVGKLEFSFGKEAGNGMGLVHAYNSVKKWGGKINIASKVNIGTSVNVRLPRENPPSWYTAMINISSRKRVIVVDDDESVHGVWRDRISTIRGAYGALELIHFYTPDSFSNWVEQNQNCKLDSIFMVDFEFANSKVNGIDLIQNCAIISNAIVVSSRAEESTFISICTAKNIKVLPKSQVPFVQLI